MIYVSSRKTGIHILRALILVCLLSYSAFATVRDVKSFGATGNGTTDDTAAIKSAIAALVSGDELYFPCGAAGIYKITSALTINTQNVTVDGQTGCASGRVLIQASGLGSGSQVITFGTVGTSAPLNDIPGQGAPLLAGTADQATSFTVGSGFASTLSPGSLVYLIEGGVDGNCSGGMPQCNGGTATAVGCDLDGCRGETAQVASVSGTTVNLTKPLNHPYDPVANVATVIKLTSVLAGVNVHDLTCDGGGTASTCWYFLQVSGLTANNLTAQHIVGAGVSCGAAGQTACGWHPSISNITITHAGGSGGFPSGGTAFGVYQSGYPVVNTVSVSSLNPPYAFGLNTSQSGGGIYSNMSSDLTGITTGRGYKNGANAHALLSNITVTNAPSGDNAFDITYYSHHMTINGCNMSADSTAGIVGFGQYSDYVTINDCTMTVGTGGMYVAIEQGQSSLGRHDQNWTISGGTFSGTSGVEVIQIGGNNTTIENTTIGPATQGINFLVAGLTGTCINNNTFAAGMKYAYASNGATGNANGNAFNGNAVLGPLPSGACGTASPAAPTGLTASAK